MPSDAYVYVVPTLHIIGDAQASFHWRASVWDVGLYFDPLLYKDKNISIINNNYWYYNFPFTGGKLEGES